MAIDFNSKWIDENRFNDQTIVPLANYGSANIDRLIRNCFYRDGLIAKLHAGRHIKNGKAIFHAETLPVDVGHHVLDAGVILETIGR